MKDVLKIALGVLLGQLAFLFAQTYIVYQLYYNIQ